MNLKQFSIIRLLILLLMGITILAAFLINNLFLGVAAFLIGMLFIFLVREKYKKVIIDERVIAVSGQAGRMTYIYTTLILGGLGLFLIFTGRQQQDFTTESLGATLSYIAMFNIAIYAIFFSYFNRKYGGDKQ